MSFGISAQWEQFSLAAGSIGATYTIVGTLNYPSRFLVLTNLTDGDVQVSISFAGTTDSIPIKAGTQLPIPMAAQKQQDGSLFQRKNTIISVKDITATGSGSFYVSSMYALGD